MPDAENIHEILIHQGNNDSRSQNDSLYPRTKKHQLSDPMIYFSKQGHIQTKVLPLTFSQSLFQIFSHSPDLGKPCFSNRHSVTLQIFWFRNLLIHEGVSLSNKQESLWAQAEEATFLCLGLSSATQYHPTVALYHQAYRSCANTKFSV